MLITTVKLPDESTSASQMVIHTSIINAYISPERVFQKHLSDQTSSHGFIDHIKYRKRASNCKWRDCEYCVQYNKDVIQKSVKMACASTQFHSLSFSVPYATPHGVRGLIKHYHLRLNHKLVNGKCAIGRIPCVCINFTDMLDKPRVIGSDPTRKTLYQLVEYFT